MSTAGVGVGMQARRGGDKARVARLGGFCLGGWFRACVVVRGYLGRVWLRK